MTTPSADQKTITPIRCADSVAPKTTAPNRQHGGTPNPERNGAMKVKHQLMGVIMVDTIMEDTRNKNFLY